MKNKQAADRLETLTEKANALPPSAFSSIVQIFTIDDNIQSQSSFVTTGKCV
jgi:hypothetical protein